MAKGFKHGAGGGTSLNFKVVGNPQPANPKENTIWVDTDAEITGWVFAAQQPETSSDGMVWILTGAKSYAEFNALKKNGIQVYPISAYQYVGGSWVSKDAKTYQGGEWEVWADYLFKSGAGQIVPFTPSNDGVGSISITNDSIVTNCNSSNSGQIMAVTTNKIDLTNYTTFVVEAVCRRSNAPTISTHANIFVYTSIPRMDAGYTQFTSYLLMDADGVRKQYRMDISKLSGSYHVGVKGVLDGTIYNIWLE